MRVGVVVPSINTCSEPDLRRLAPAGAEIFATRVRLTGASRRELMDAARDVDAPVGLLCDLEPDLILFHCTAASVIGGRAHAEDLERRLAAASAFPTASTAKAIVDALAELGARRVALVAPYGPQVTENEADFLRDHGLEITQTVALDVQPVADYPTWSPEDWTRAVIGAVVEPGDAVLLSCTNIRALDAIEPIERELGVPVVTSNQAAGWYVARELGAAAPLHGLGALLAGRVVR